MLQAENQSMHTMQQHVSNSAHTQQMGVLQQQIGQLMDTEHKPLLSVKVSRQTLSSCSIAWQSQQWWSSGHHWPQYPVLISSEQHEQQSNLTAAVTSCQELYMSAEAAVAGQYSVCVLADTNSSMQRSSGLCRRRSLSSKLP